MYCFSHMREIRYAKERGNKMPYMYIPTLSIKEFNILVRPKAKLDCNGVVKAARGCELYSIALNASDER